MRPFVLLVAALATVRAAPVAQTAASQTPAPETDSGYRATPDGAPETIAQPLQRCREWLDVPFDKFNLPHDRYCMCITDVPDSAEPERTSWHHDPAFAYANPASDPCAALGPYIGTIRDGKMVA